MPRLQGVVFELGRPDNVTGLGVDGRESVLDVANVAEVVKVAEVAEVAKALEWSC